MRELQEALEQAPKITPEQAERLRPLRSTRETANGETVS